MTAAQIALLGFGYPASVAVITRFVPVVRDRRWRWLAVHHAGVAAVIAGWAMRREGVAVALNGAWLLGSSIWYVLGGRPSRPGAGSAGRPSSPRTPRS